VILALSSHFPLRISSAASLLAVCLTSTLVAGPATKGKQRAPAVDPTSDLAWPLPPEPARIRFVRDWHGADDLRKKPGRMRRFLVGPERQEGIKLRKPYGVTTDAEGRMYVTDTGLGAVLVFDEQEHEVRPLGIDGRVRLVTPIGVAVDSLGRVFVSDADLDQVFGFGVDGRVELALGRAEGMKNPAGIAIDRPRGRLYVVDSHSHRLFVYDMRGVFLGHWGERGPGQGLFNFPTNVAVDRDGNVYVVDTGNFRVQIFDPDGNPRATFGEAGDGFGKFTRPKGIALDSEGHVYVVDAAFNNFQVFDDRGRLLLFVGALGTAPGQFWLPAGIHIDAQDRIYVVDQVNRRVQVFQYLPDSSGSEGEQS
jgi:DNA-binding beta-propeller fold protein YncE